MSKAKDESPLEAVRIPKRKGGRKRPKRPPAELPEPIATYEI